MEKLMNSNAETLLPIIGQWYRLDDYQLFEVVAMDRDDRTIEIQHFDGMIEELDFVSWEQSHIVESNPPEDWSGAYDMSPLDYGVDIEKHTNSIDIDYLDSLKV